MGEAQEGPCYTGTIHPSARRVKGAGLCPSFGMDRAAPGSVRGMHLPNLAGNCPWWGCSALTASTRGLTATSSHPVPGRSKLRGAEISIRPLSMLQHRAINTLSPAIPHIQALAALCSQGKDKKPQHRLVFPPGAASVSTPKQQGRHVPARI